jgi:phosphocarrier protein HPr
MKQLTMQIKTEVGLHARPAALFVQQASQFSSDIQIRNLTTESDWVDARSILSVLTLGVEMDHKIELQADGKDEQQAIETLSALVDSGFGEQ